MPDAFFQRKRKRTGAESSDRNGGVSRRDARSGPSSRGGRGRAGGASKASVGGRKLRRDDHSDDAGGSDGDPELEGRGGAEGMTNLRHDYEADQQLLSDDEAAKKETPAEARVRLARMYLNGLKADDLDGADADALASDQANIAARLQSDASAHRGKMHIFISSRLLAPPSRTSILGVRGHRLSLTGAYANAETGLLVTTSKDGDVRLWDLQLGKLEAVLPRSRRTERAAAPGGSAAPTKSKRSGAARRKDRARTRERAQNNGGGKGKNREQDDDNDDDAMDMDVSGYPSTLRLSDGEGHTDEIWSIAVSSDGKFLATGGRDKRIGIWALERSPSGSTRPRWLKALMGHKSEITALRFRLGSHTLFSASSDRTLKVFDIAQLSYIETLFGHQESVMDLDVLRAEVAVSAGGRERAARWWKVQDESQLVFRGGGAGKRNRVRDVLEGGDLVQEEEVQQRKNLASTFFEGSIECVAMIDDQHFLTGGDSGTISLWSLAKKKPVFTFPLAHGFDVTSTISAEAVEGSTGERPTRHARWITSLACLPYGDIFASGSWDGHIRLWALDATLRNFAPLPYTIPAQGFINSLQLFCPPLDVSPTLLQQTYWRRRGGLDAVQSGSESESESESDPTDSDMDSTASGSGSTAGPLTNGHAPVNGQAARTNGHRRPNKAAAQYAPPILVAALGQEPKMGRWTRIKEARNGAIVVRLPYGQDVAEGEESDEGDEEDEEEGQQLGGLRVL